MRGRGKRSSKGIPQATGLQFWTFGFWGSHIVLSDLVLVLHANFEQLGLELKTIPDQHDGLLTGLVLSLKHTR